MRALIINEVCGSGSTGRICCGIADKLAGEGHEVRIAYGRSPNVPDEYKKYAVRIGNAASVLLHALETRLFDMHGFGSRMATRRFIEWAEEYDPEFVWLHNLHGYYVNIEILFGWIKKRPRMKVQWTLHDCWAFTGHCTYFTAARCDKWKSSCEECPQKKEYPASFLLDRSRRNYRQKKELFCGIPNMKIITPSKWLAGLVRESFLKEYLVEVLYNEIDRTVFKPTKSDFRERYGLAGKTVILGVASIWSKRKGLDDFLQLSKMLGDGYAIVLVGLSKRQIRKLSGMVTPIGKVSDGRELAGIYSGADYFLNPSKEETFGMTTLEAASCGTRAIVYDSTASSEVARECGGVAVPEGVENLYREITGEEWLGGAFPGGR